MIEAPCAPRPGVVAGLATGSERIFVLVVFLVAADAGDAGILEGRRQVALLAFKSVVLAEQREAGKPVVDLGRFPVALVVTGFAFLSFLALVLVVLLVAGNADCRQLVLE